MIFQDVQDVVGVDVVLLLVYLYHREYWNIVNKTSAVQRSSSEVTEMVSDGTDEESMMACIKNFDPEQAKLIRTFVEQELRLPVAMHQKFSQLRTRLATGQKVFRDIDSLEGQLSLLLDACRELDIMQQHWLTYGSSVSYMVKKTGRFVENKNSVFESVSLLGCFVSLRAKYIVLALKDLLRMNIPEVQ